MTENYEKISIVKVICYFINNINKITAKTIKRCNKQSLLSIQSQIIFLLWIFLVILVNPIKSEKVEIRKLQGAHKIHLKFTNTPHKYVKIINPDYSPDRIYINGKSSTIENGHINDDTFGTLDITLEFDEKKSNYDSMFKEIDNIVSIDLSDFDTTGVTSMKSMFQSCNSLESINFKNVDTSSVQIMTSMFEGCKSLVSLDLSSLNTENVLYMDNMFKACKNIKTIDLTNFNPKLQKMERMFSECSSLTSLILGNIDTSSITTMEELFYDCYSLEFVNLTSFNTENLQNMAKMFCYCSVLTSIDLSEMDTSKVVNMNYLFHQCYQLKSLNLSHFYTPNLVYVEGMFFTCTLLKYLNIDNFDTSKVVTMKDMFRECRSIESINVSSFDTSQVTNMGGMFQNCNYLTSLDLSNFNFTKVRTMEYMFQGSRSIKTIELPKNTNSPELKSLYNTFYECSSLKSIDLSSFNFTGITLYFLFYNCEALKTVEFPKSKKIVTEFIYMFLNCKSLVSLDLSNMVITSSYTMSRFFYNCISLTSLDLSNVESESISQLSYTFYNCTSLKTINFTNFRMKFVSSLSSMFYNCFSLISIDLSSFDTSKVYDMQNVFYECHSVTSINISSFNTANVYYMTEMFYGCYKLRSLNLSHFYTPLLYSLKGMFYKCAELTSLDLSGFTSSNIYDYRNMFYGCTNLKFINYYNFDHSPNSPDFDNFLFEAPSNLIICIRKDFSYKITPLLSYKQCIINDCSIDLNNNNKKVVDINRMCLDDCLEDEINKYDFESFCYDKCPKWTISKKDNQYLCEYKVYDCLDDHPFLIIKDNSCSDECNSINFFENACKLNNGNVKSKSILISNIITGIQEGELDKYIKGIINGEDLLKNENNTLYQLTTSSNQFNKNYQDISSIILGECETLLIKKYNILSNETLLIFKTEQNLEGILIPFIEFELFSPSTKEILDLDICRNEDKNISILISKSINEDILYKYDQHNCYYDICCQLDIEFETDISLYDKINEFNTNYSLCPENCIYNGYESEKKKIICNCKIPETMFITDINKDEISYKIEIQKRFSNLHLLKCYKLVFSIKGLTKNLGNYFILLIIIFHIASAIYFYFRGYNSLCKQINDMIYGKNTETGEKRFEDVNAPKKIYISITDDKGSSSKNSELNEETRRKTDSDKSTNNNLFKEKSKNNTYKANKKESTTEYENNCISYKDAQEKDKRTFCQFYISFIKQKHFLLFTFNPFNDYNPFIIKTCIFLFSIALYLFINAMFFNDDKMHEIYIEEGSFNIPGHN